MTRPLDDNTNSALTTAKVRQRVTRLERRPGPPMSWARIEHWKIAGVDSSNAGGSVFADFKDADFATNDPDLFQGIYTGAGFGMLQISTVHNLLSVFAGINLHSPTRGGRHELYFQTVAVVGGSIANPLFPTEAGSMHVPAADHSDTFTIPLHGHFWGNSPGGSWGLGLGYDYQGGVGAQAIDKWGLFVFQVRDSFSNLA